MSTANHATPNRRSSQHCTSHEMLDLAHEIAQTEGLPLEQAIRKALQQFPDLMRYAIDWDAEIEAFHRCSNESDR